LKPTLVSLVGGCALSVWKFILIIIQRISLAIQVLVKFIKNVLKACKVIQLCRPLISKPFKGQEKFPACYCWTWASERAYELL